MSSNVLVKDDKTLVDKFMVYPSYEIIDGKKITKLKVLMDTKLYKSLKLPPSGKGIIDRNKYKNPHSYMRDLGIEVPDSLYEYTFITTNDNITVYAPTVVICRVAIIEMVIEQHPSLKFSMRRWTELSAYEKNEDEVNQTIDALSINIFGDDGDEDY